MNKIEIELLKLQNKAYKKNEVPVGCVITKNNKIISKGYNKREKTNNILNHAEIIAIRKAAKKLKTWKLIECELFVTLKPCSICENVIRQSRISKVYYYSDKYENKKEYNKTEFIKIDNNSFSKILKEFFENMRKNK